MALTWRFADRVGANTGGETSHTFTSVPLGTAASDRWVYVAVIPSTNTATAISSVTVGGVSMTAAAGNPSGLGAPSERVFFYKLNVTSGTSANVVVSYSGGGVWNCVISVWTDNGEPTEFHQTLTSTVSSNAMSVALDVPADGKVIAAATRYNMTSAVWSGLTERSDDNTDDFTAASDEGLSSETGRTITATFTGGLNFESSLGALSFSTGGGGPSPVTGSGSGTLPLSGSGSGVARATGQGSGLLPMSGSAGGATLAGGTLAGSLSITGVAVGKARVSGQAAGVVPLAGAASGQALASVQGAGLLPLSGAAEGAVLATGQASGDLPLSGFGSGVTGVNATGQAAGTLPLAGSGVGVARVLGQAAGAILLEGTAVAAALAAGQVAGGLLLSGSGAGAALAEGMASGALPLSGMAQGSELVPTSGRLKVWTGTSWEAKPVKVWTGAAWVEKPLKVWDGATWS